MSDQTSGPRERIEGLKSITRYCGWDSTTTLKKYYSEGGLPLHTLGSPKKPRYFAWADELDAWIAQQDAGSLHAEQNPLADRDRGAAEEPNPSYSAIAPAAPAQRHFRFGRAVPLPFLIGFALIVAAAATFAVWNRDKPQPIDRTNGLTFRDTTDRGLEVEFAGETLWTDQQLERKRVAVGRLQANQEPVVVGLLTSSGERAGQTPTLVFLDPRSGRPRRSPRPLPEGDAYFPNYSNTYGGKLDLIDLDGDGVHEVLAVFEHHPNWPAYSVLYEPMRDRSRLLFAATGHFNYVTHADLDDDGHDEILFEGVNNPTGWRSGIAAIKLVPALHVESVSTAMAASPNANFRIQGDEGLYWYALGTAVGCGRAACLDVDLTNRTITITRGNDRGTVLDFNGFDVAVPSALSVDDRSAARRAAYQQVRAALRFIEHNEEALAVVAVAKAIELVEQAGLPNLLDYLLHLEVRALAQSGAIDQALEHAAAIRDSQRGEYSHSFDVAAAMHLAGEFEHAEQWYERGLTEDSVDKGKSRPAWELLRGLVLVLTDQGRFEDALTAIGRFSEPLALGEATDDLREFVLWRRGTAQTKETSERLAARVPDYPRFWGLASLYANQTVPAKQLLERVRKEQAVNSETLPLLQLLEAELMAEVEDPEQATAHRLLALAAIDRESRMNPVIRSHLSMTVDGLPIAQRPSP